MDVVILVVVVSFYGCCDPCCCCYVVVSYAKNDLANLIILQPKNLIPVKKTKSF